MTAKRRFSLEEQFMKFDTDDLVYGFMRSISTMKPNEDGTFTEYLSKTNYTKNRKVLYGISGTTSRTLKYRLEKLIEKGLVIDGEIETEDGKAIPAYIFPQDYEGLYKIISLDMLRYLLSTRNPLAIRVYLYLLDCSTLKENYAFTIREIKKAFGYAETTKSADFVISNNLQSFYREGIIKFHTETFEKVIGSDGKEIPVQRMVLDFVATDISQLSKVKIG